MSPRTWPYVSSSVAAMRPWLTLVASPCACDRWHAVRLRVTGCRRRMCRAWGGAKLLLLPLPLLGAGGGKVRWRTCVLWPRRRYGSPGYSVASSTAASRSGSCMRGWQRWQRQQWPWPRLGRHRLRHALLHMWSVWPACATPACSAALSGVVLALEHLAVMLTPRAPAAAV